MNAFKLTFFMYMGGLCIALFLPTSSMYHNFSSKLIIAQIYVIPIVLLTLLVYIVCRKQSPTEESQE